MVVHSFNPSTQEAEAGRSLSSRSAWSTERVLGQAPKLHRETLSRKNKNKNKKTKTNKQKNNNNKKKPRAAGQWWFMSLVLVIRRQRLVALSGKPVVHSEFQNSQG